jgi:hypothetical protein
LIFQEAQTFFHLRPKVKLLNGGPGLSQMLKLSNLANVLEPVVDVGFETVRKVLINHEILKVLNFNGALLFTGSFNAPLYFWFHVEVDSGNCEVLAGLSKMHLERG